MPFVDIGPRIRILGTAHISQQSVEDVRFHIAEFDPEIVAVELCQSRHDALMEERRFDKEGLLKVLKEGKAPLVLLQSMLSAEQRKLGLDENMQPGAELLAAVHEANKSNKEVALVDRDIQITLRRAWKRMTFFQKMKVLMGLLSESDDDEDEVDIDELLQNSDVLSSLMEELKTFSPGAGEVLIDERDQFLAGKILQLPEDKKILAVVGAGHMQGIQEHIKKGPVGSDHLNAINQPPKARFFSKIFPWLIPLALVFFVAWGMSNQSINWIELFTIWTISNAVFAALACMIARGHPYAILTAALASPITSLNPALAAGWFAGYVQLKVKEPTAKDLQDFLKLEEISQFWKNPAGKVLLVTALTNLGSMIGAWVATAGYLSGWRFPL
ncbi:MAG: TraB/GumN family protein [Candidatus Poseidoniales archaeon]